MPWWPRDSTSRSAPSRRASAAPSASCAWRWIRRGKPVSDREGMLSPDASLQERLARRLAAETGEAVVPPAPRWSEPDWEEVAPGIFCKLLANDVENHRVSMLVRLLPNVEYPA